MSDWPFVAIIGVAVGLFVFFSLLFEDRRHPETRMGLPMILVAASGIAVVMAGVLAALFFARL